MPSPPASAPGQSEVQLARVIPPSPPIMNRVAGAMLLAVTLGAVALTSFFGSVWNVFKPFFQALQAMVGLS